MATKVADLSKVFIYWDNSNIFISAQQTAVEREGEAARYRTRVHFRNLLELAHAGRPIERVVAGGAVPPELRHVWNRLENEGVTVRLPERGALDGREQGVDQTLQTEMLRDGFDHNGAPGVLVMLTGDGAGFADGVGFHADMEPTWKGCTGAAGASRCCRGGAVATAGCGNGRRRPASSSPWTISTTASPSWNRRRRAARRPSRAPRSPST